LPLVKLTGVSPVLLVADLYDAPHGFREFGVQDADGHDIAFGQRITR
jgi:hypothetical protein